MSQADTPRLTDPLNTDVNSPDIWVFGFKELIHLKQPMLHQRIQHLTTIVYQQMKRILTEPLGTDVSKRTLFSPVMRPPVSL